MKLMLDTHLLVWMAAKSRSLHDAELGWIAGAETIVGSVVSLWELRIKWQRYHASGERKGPIDPLEVWDWSKTFAIPLLDLTPAVAVATVDPSFSHSDPFDELLLAHAQEEGCRLLTRDRELVSHPVALVA